MKKIVLLFVLLASSLMTAQVPNYQWSKSFGGEGNGLVGNTVVDNQGNVFTCGIFKGTRDFDPSAAISNLTASGNNFDIFISKLNATGDFQWAFKFGAFFPEANCSLTLDNTGNVYLTGSMAGTIDFDPGVGVVNESNTSGGFPNTFILKLNNNGTFGWVKKFAGGENYPTFIKADSLGNLIITGAYGSGTIDFDPSTAISTATGLGVYLVKLTQTGDFVWVKTMTPNVNIEVNDLQLDTSNNIYMTGIFGGTQDFDTSVAVFEITAPAKGMFVLKSNSQGQFVWAKGMSCTSPIVPESLAVDSNNNVFVSGNFQGTADFDPSAAVYNLVSNVPTGAGSPAKHIFVEKLNPDGSFAWVNRTGQILNDFDSGYDINYNSGSVLGGDMVLDSSGNVIQSGLFQGNLNFGSINKWSELCQNCSNSQYPRSNDIFLTKIDTNGNNVWVTNYSSYSIYANTVLYDLTTNAANSIYLHGQTFYPVDFDSTQAGNELTPSTINVFMAKFNQQTLNVDENIFFKNNLKLYPNPSTGNFNIQIEENLVGAKVLVYNMLGQNVKSFHLENAITNQNLESGMYLLEIEKDGNKTSRKLIVN